MTPVRRLRVNVCRISCSLSSRGQSCPRSKAGRSRLTCGPSWERYCSLMFIRGVGTSAPSTRYKQSECWAVLQQSEVYTRLAPRSRALLRKVFSGENGIESRALALDPLTDAFNLTPNA